MSQFVWVARRLFEEADGLYVFEDEHRARQFAERYPDAIISRSPVMNDSAAAQFLIDEGDEG